MRLRRGRRVRVRRARRLRCAAAGRRRRARTRRGRARTQCGRTLRVLRRELARLDRAGRAHGAVGGELRGLADLPQIRARQRAGRPRSAVRLPVRRARRDRRRLHGRDRGRQAAPLGPRGLPVHPLPRCGCLPERQPAARRYRRARVGRRAASQCTRASPTRPQGPIERDSSARKPGLFARSQRLETISERFDEWESCVSWVPVTEMGDPDQRFGYLFGTKGAPAGYRAALHIDRERLGRPGLHVPRAGGGDRPGRTCQDEPGEAVD